MATRRKAHGNPDQKYYESLDVIAEFEPVRQWLNKNCKKFIQADPPSNKSLAQLTYAMLNFQEDAFGRNSSNVLMTKLPFNLFTDYRPGGSLCHILSTAHRIKTEQTWRRFDFSSPSRMDRNVELFISIMKDLHVSKTWEPPTVYLDSHLGSDQISHLSEIVRRHNGILTEVKEEATHIVYPVPPSTQVKADYYTVVSTQSKFHRLHWWNMPDSYDTCVGVAEFPKAQIATPPNKPYLVSSQWILQLDVYHEWMNEMDHQVSVSEGKITPVTPFSGNSQISWVKVDLPGSVPMEQSETSSRKSGSRNKRRQSSSPTIEKKRKRTSVSNSGSSRQKKISKDEEQEE